MEAEDRTLKELSELMGVLGVESRLRIVTLLRDHESLCVNALACHLDISQSAVSQHLRILHLKGFVTSRKCGYYTHYCLDRDKFDNALKLLAQLSIRRDRVDPDSKCKSRGENQCAKTKASAGNRKT